MMKKNRSTEDFMKKGSFIQRKRPSVRNMMEDYLGPAAQLDEVLLGKPMNLTPEESEKLKVKSRTHGKMKDHDN